MATFVALLVTVAHYSFQIWPDITSAFDGIPKRFGIPEKVFC